MGRAALRRPELSRRTGHRRGPGCHRSPGIPAALAEQREERAAPSRGIGRPSPSLSSGSLCPPAKLTFTANVHSPRERTCREFHSIRRWCRWSALGAGPCRCPRGNRSAPRGNGNGRIPTGRAAADQLVPMATQGWSSAIQDGSIEPRGYRRLSSRTHLRSSLDAANTYAGQRSAGGLHSREPRLSICCANLRMNFAIEINIHLAELPRHI